MFNSWNILKMIRADEKTPRLGGIQEKTASAVVHLWSVNRSALIPWSFWDVEVRFSTAKDSVSHSWGQTSGRNQTTVSTWAGNVVFSEDDSQHALLTQHRLKPRDSPASQTNFPKLMMLREIRWARWFGTTSGGCSSPRWMSLCGTLRWI